MYVILNPHISDFISEPLAFKYIKRRPLKKYAYLISEAVKKWGKVEILADSTATGLLPLGVYLFFPGFIRKLITRIEIYFWRKRNGLGDDVIVHFSPNTVTDKSVLLFFAYKNYKNPRSLIKTCSAFSRNIAHLSHYHGDSRQLSETLRAINNIYVAADTDISDAAMFNIFFSWYKKPVVLFSFDVASRFKKIKPVAERRDMAVATGTFHYIEETAEEGSNKAVVDFYNSTGATALHPLRRLLYENRDKYAAVIECLCSPYIEKSKNLLSFIIPQKLFAAQKKYFSFDIVEKYNEYKFAIVGEEVYNGLPGIGAFEAMACGTVLLAYAPCYKGIGLEENVHYIPHNNSLDAIEAIIKSESSNAGKLENISANAVSWINENMQSEVIFKRLVEQLCQLS
jgi:hypothetical protein